MRGPASFIIRVACLRPKAARHSNHAERPFGAWQQIDQLQADHDAHQHHRQRCFADHPGRRHTHRTVSRSKKKGRHEIDQPRRHTRHGKRVYVCRARKCISRKADPVDALIAGGDVEGARVRGLVV